MNSTRFIASFKLGFVLCLFAVLGSCAESDWDWMRGGRNEKKTAKPVARNSRSQPPAERRTAARPQPEKASATGSDDEKARAVDSKVNDYVKSMEPSSDYEPNDLNAKIRRQRDRREAANRPDGPSATQEPESSGREVSPDSGSTARSETTARGDRAKPTESAASHPPARTDRSTNLRNPEPESTARMSSDATEPGVDTSEKTPTIPSKSAPSDADAKVELTASDEPDPNNHGESDHAEKSPQGDGPSHDPAFAKPHADPKKEAPADAATHAAPAKEPKSSISPPDVSDVKIGGGETADAEPKSSSQEPEHRTTANSPPRPIEPVDTFKQRLAEQEGRVQRDPNNVEHQFTLRMMYLVDGQDDKAMAFSDDVDEDLRELMEAQLCALISARAGAGRDPAAWANKQMDAVDALRSLIRSRADLMVPRVVLCTEVLGFGQYQPIAPAEFPTGQDNQVLLYIEVDNFSKKRTNSGMYRTLLSVRLSLLDSKGAELWNRRDENVEDLTRRPRDDFFLSLGPLTIPNHLPPGDYSLKAEIEDVLAGKINSSTAAFKIIRGGPTSRPNG